MKREYSQIQPGDELPAASYKLDSSMVADYIKAVEETGDIYVNSGLVPPTAIAAYAIKALTQVFTVPPGTVHTSQSLEFLDTLNVGETITCQAQVNRKQERGRFRFLTIDLIVSNQDKRKVMTGKTSFVLPEV
ncbi:MAG: MaoC family dehydratase [Chloroflexota bacterium]